MGRIETNSKLYYGSGSCTIETESIIALEIRYKGAIRIVDKTSDNYHIVANAKKILIVPNNVMHPLSDLFDYSGEFTITSVLASDANRNTGRISYKKVMDYSELMDTKAEDLTTVSEGLDAGHLHRAKVKKTVVVDSIIKNKHSTGGLYLANGTPYIGAYHIHPSSDKVMTGGEHTSESKDLFIKRGEIMLKPLTQQVKVRPKKKVAKRRKIRGSGGGSSGSGGGGY